ncbi:MAG: hypothetical protein RDV41_00685 [Planctomycetota bacterium]|nr:hypothetical protein [Planctomycetota bacterium]
MKNERHGVIVYLLALLMLLGSKIRKSKPLSLVAVACGIAFLVFCGWAIFKLLSLGVPVPRKKDTTHNGSRPETDATRQTELARVEAQTVQHESGAQVFVPSRQILYSNKVAFTSVPTPPALEKVPLESPVMRFDSFSGEVIDGKTFVDLPAGESVKDAVVLVRSQLGFWLPIPSEPVTLANGKPGRRVKIDRQPTPWFLAVARADSAAATAAESGDPLLLLEQLNWTDQDALELRLAEESSRYSAPPEEGWSLCSPAYADEGGKKKKITDPVELLKKAIEMLYRTKGAVRQGSQRLAWERYLEALDYLSQIRQTKYWESLINLTTSGWASGSADVLEQRRCAGLPDSWSVPVVLETLLAGYAPWGLDLTLRFAASDENIMADGFDLRILKPLGELLWADVPIAVSGKSSRLAGPWNEELDKIIKDQKLVAGEAKRSVLLRLYSPRAIEAGYIETALEWTRDYIIRWGPVVIGLASGGVGAAALPAAYAGMDIVIGWMDKEFRHDAVTYAGFEYGQIGHEQVLSAVAGVEEGQLQILGQNFSVKNINFRMLLVDLAVTTALVCYRWNPGEVRELATGPKGYKDGEDGIVFAADQPNVPPILVIGWVESSYVQPANSRYYTVGAKFNRVWHLDYSKVYAERAGGKGLNSYIRHGTDDFASGAKNELTGSAFSSTGARKGMPWADMLTPLKADWIPSAPVIDTAPQEQHIAFSLRKDLIAMICTKRGISEPWDTVNLSELGLEVVLEMKGEDPPSLTLPLQESPGWKKQKDSRRCAVRLADENHVPMDDSDLPAFQKGAQGELPRLLTRYTVVVKDKDGAKEWYRAEADFRDKKARRFFMTRYGSFWWGDGDEKVPWHEVETVETSAPPFVTGWAFMEVPFRYRITGSVVHSGENLVGTAFRSDHDATYVPQWQGNTASFSQWTGKVEQAFTVTTAEQNTRIGRFVFVQRSEEEGESARFELENIPLRYTGKVGKSGVEFFVFAIKDAEVKSHVKSFNSKVTRTVTERDPSTQKEVQSTVTSEITAIGVPPDEGGDCYLCLLFWNRVDKQLEEMLKKGEFTEAEFTEAMEKCEKELREWRGK